MAEERKKYDMEFKLTVVEVSFARGKVKEVAEEYNCRIHFKAFREELGIKCKNVTAQSIFG